MKPSVSSRHVRTGSPAACLLAAAIATVLALHHAQAAATRTKAATGTDLTQVASWGGTLPASGDAAAWTSTSLGAGLTLPSALPATGSLSISVTGALSDIDITGAGTLTLGSSGVDLSASAVNMSIATPITLGASQTWTVNSGKTLTASGVISGPGFGITKAGAGTLTLAGGANTYSGATTVNGGTLVLDYTADNSKLFDTTALTMAGSNLQLSGGTHTELVGSFNLNVGASSITQVTGSATLNLGGITRSAGGTLAIGAGGITTSITGTASDILAASSTKAYAVVGGTDWAAQNADKSFIVGLSTVNTYTPTTPTTLGGVGGSYADVATGVDTTLAANDANSRTLRFNQAEARTIDLNGKTATLTYGGILVTPTVGANLSQINGGSLKAGSGVEMIIFQNNTSGGLTIGSTVIDSTSGASALTKSGAGTLTLAGANSYSGGTIVNQGTLQIGGGGSLGSVNGALTVTGGTLDLNGNDLGVGNFTGTGGTIVNNSTGTNKTLTIGNNNGAGGTYTGVIADHTSGTGTTALTKTGTGTLTLSGPNTYSGKTSVQNGTLSFTTLANVGGGASALGSIAPGDTANGTIDLGSGTTAATLQYSGSGASTSDRTINLAGTTGGATIYVAAGTGLLTLNGNVTATGSGAKTLTVGFNNNGLSLVMNGSISDSGAGASSLSVGPGGGGTSMSLTLGSTASSYTGPTTVTRGVLNYSSIKNVNGGNSSLGNPAVGNGTIQVGASEAVELHYKGAGDTTDRALNLAGPGGLKLFNEGSGLLKFTSDLTATGTGAKSITLQTGNFEMGGAIPDSASGGINSLNVQFVNSCTLSATNSSYSGATLVVGGGAVTIKSIKNIGSNCSLGTGSNVANGTITIGNGANGGILVYGGTGSGSGGEGTTDRVIKLDGNGAGVIDQSGTGLLKFTGGVTATTGTRPLTLQGSTSGSGEVSGAITNGAATAVSLTKAGTGAWTLSGTNSYSGATLVSGGALLVNNTLSGTGAVTVQSTATLGGTGTISGTVSVNAGGTIQPTLSGPPGTLTFASATAPTFTAFSTLKIRVPSTSTADQVALSNATPVFACGNLNLVIDTTGLSGNVTGATLVTTAKGSGGISGSFHSVTVTGNTAYAPTVNYNISLGTITLDLISSISPFENWATTTHGLSGPAAAPAADPDHDGLTNVLEFVLGGEPNPANPGTDSVGLLPTFAQSGSNMIFTYRRTALSLTQPGISITTEYGSTLTGWATAQNGILGVTINFFTDFYGTGIDKVEVAIPQSLATGTKLFARLHVSMP